MFGGGLKHAVNQVTTQKKATMKKLIHKIFFAKKTNLQKQKNMVPMYLAPLSPKNKKILEITAPPAAKKYTRK